MATGLQPVLMCGLPWEPARPWDEGGFCEPQDTAAIDRPGAAQLLDGWWREYPPIWPTGCYGLIRRLYPDRRSARVRGQRQYCLPSARASGVRRCLGLTLR